MNKILCDLDGCLANTPRMISKWSKELFDIGPGDIPYQETAFNIEEAWEGMNFQKLKKIFGDKKFWEEVKPFHMAGKFAGQLLEWAEVHIVTDRRWYPALVTETETWLKTYKIPYTTLAIIKGNEKDRYCREHNIDLVVEDRLANIELLCKVCPVVVMRWPYNLEAEKLQKSGVELADNYYQATRIISSLLNRPIESWVNVQSTEEVCRQ